MSSNALDLGFLKQEDLELYPRYEVVVGLLGERKLHAWSLER